MLKQVINKTSFNINKKIKLFKINKNLNILFNTELTISNFKIKLIKLLFSLFKLNKFSNPIH